MPSNPDLDEPWRYYSWKDSICRAKGTAFDGYSELFIKGKGWEACHFFDATNNGTPIFANQFQQYAYAFESPKTSECFIDDMFVASLLAIPHGDVTDLELWSVRNGNNELSIGFPLMNLKTGWTTNEKMGLPYGKFARLILIYIYYEVVRTQSHEVEIGSDMSILATELGIAYGKNFRQNFEEQIPYLLNCHFALRDIADPDTMPSAIMNENDYFLLGEKTKGENRKHKFVVDSVFVEKSANNPLPFSMDMVRELSGSSYALDAYFILCYFFKGLTARKKFTKKKSDLIALNGHGTKRESKYWESFEKALFAIENAQNKILSKLKSSGLKEIDHKKHGLLSGKIDLTASDEIEFSYNKKLVILDKG